MRKCWLFALLLMWCCLSLTGCAAVQGALAWLMGTTPETVDEPPIKAVINFLQTIPGIGTAIASGLAVGRWGWVEVAHRKLIAAGKKDDNNNGVDDALETKPPAAPQA